LFCDLFEIVAAISREVAGIRVRIKCANVIAYQWTEWNWHERLLRLSILIDLRKIKKITKIKIIAEERSWRFTLTIVEQA
jgi:hypothetical protein